MDGATNTIMPVMPTGHSGWGSGSNNWIWFFIIFILLGYGGGFNNRNQQDLMTNEFLYSNLNNNVSRGFENNTNQNFQIQRDILENSATAQNSMCNGFGNVNSNISQNTDKVLMGMNQGFNANTLAINEAVYKSQNEACSINRNIDTLRFNSSQESNYIIQNDNANTQKILDKICQMENNAQAQKIQDLQAQLSTANMQLSQQAQSANLISTLRPFPQPAYITCSPYTAYNAYASCGTC